MCILLQHTGIDKTLRYCWGPVSSLKECVWQTLRDISSHYGRLIPKWNKWGRPCCSFHFFSPCFFGIFHLGSQYTHSSADKLVWQSKALTCRLLITWDVLSRCEYQELGHNCAPLCDSESFVCQWEIDKYLTVEFIQRTIVYLNIAQLLNTRSEIESNYIFFLKENFSE